MDLLYKAHRGAEEIPAVEGEVAQALAAFGLGPAEAEEGVHPREVHLLPYPGKAPECPRLLATDARDRTARSTVKRIRRSLWGWSAAARMQAMSRVRLVLRVLVVMLIYRRLCDTSLVAAAWS